MDKDTLTVLLSILAVSTLVDIIKLYLKIRNSRKTEEMLLVKATTPERLEQDQVTTTTTTTQSSRQLSDIQLNLQKQKASLDQFRVLIRQWGQHLKPEELEDKQMISTEAIKEARVKLELARLVVQSMRENGFQSKTNPSLEDALKDMTRVQSKLEYLAFHKSKRKLKAHEKAQATRAKRRQSRSS